MSLKIGQALEDGVQRTTTSVALAFVAIEFVLQIVANLSTSTAVVRVFETLDYPPGSQPGMSPSDLAAGTPILPVSAGVASAIALVATIASVFVVIGLYRAFVDDVDALSGDLFTRRALGAFGHFVLLGIVFALMALVNVVPILGQIVFFFLLTALWFAPLRIAAEDDGVVDALKRSWALTSGQRLRLFGLGVVYVVIAGVAGGVVGAILGFVPVVGFLGTSLVSGYFAVLNASVTVAAYEQLEGEDDDDSGSVTPQPTAAGS